MNGVWKIKSPSTVRINWNLVFTISIHNAISLYFELFRSKSGPCILTWIFPHVFRVVCSYLLINLVHAFSGSNIFCSKFQPISCHWSHSIPSLKHQKTSGLPIFPGSIERGQWHGMRVVFLLNKQKKIYTLNNSLIIIWRHGKARIKYFLYKLWNDIKQSRVERCGKRTRLDLKKSGASGWSWGVGA